MNSSPKTSMDQKVEDILENVSRIIYASGRGPERWPGACPLRKGCPHTRKRSINASIIVACAVVLVASWWAGGLYATRIDGEHDQSTTIIDGAALAVPSKGMLDHLVNATAKDRHIETISGWSVHGETTWLVGYVADDSFGNDVSYASFLGTVSGSMIRFMTSDADSVAATDKTDWIACPTYSATFYGREYELQHWCTELPSGSRVDFYSWSDTIR